MQVAKWGNSLAVRIPAAVVEALELKEGDEIEIHVADARELAIARKPGREDLLKRLHEAGHTIVMVTHDPEMAALAQRKIALSHGKVFCHPVSNMVRLR